MMQSLVSCYFIVTAAVNGINRDGYDVQVRASLNQLKLALLFVTSPVCHDYYGVNYAT